MIRIPLLLFPAVLIVLMSTAVWAVMMPGAGDLSLRFTGPLSPLWALLIGVVGCGLMYRLYRRESDPVAGGVLRWAAACRVSALLLVLLLLCGPVLDYAYNEGEPGRVILLVDRSESMLSADPEMSAGRKLIWATQFGMLEPGRINPALGSASGRIAEVNRLVELALAGFRDGRPVGAWMEQVAETGRRVIEALEQADGVDRLFAEERLPHRGEVREEIWWRIGGEQVRMLREDDRFPGRPDEVGRLGSLLTERDIGDDFGRRVRGALIPPQTGSYVFFLSSDDESEFWLEREGGEGGLRLLVRQERHVPYLEWRTQSEPVRLQAGRAYAFEWLHKEGRGGDHAAVGWRLPDGTMERPIGGERLAMSAAEASRVTRQWPGRAKVIEELRRRIIEPAEVISRGDVPRPTQSSLLTAMRQSSRWLDHVLEEAFDRQGLAWAEADPRVAAVLESFDQMSRLERMERMLLGDAGVLSPLRLNYDIEIRTFAELTDAPLLQLSMFDRDRPMPEGFGELTMGRATNLSAPIMTASGHQEEPRRQAGSEESVGPSTFAVLLSDGQHNLTRPGSPTPEQAAGILGRSGVQLVTAGVGSGRPPRHLSLVGFRDVPAEIFEQNVLSGYLRVYENVEGVRYRLLIEFEGQVLFEQAITSRQFGNEVAAAERMREVAFSVPIEELVERERSRLAGEGVTMLSMPLRLTARIEAEAEYLGEGGSELDLLTRVISHQRRILMVDGRPRWSFRYLRNIFDRDPQWEVNDVLPIRRDGRLELQRGRQIGRFPDQFEDLMRYDLIVLGEIPVELFAADELDWIRQFVEVRGGGLLWIDGQRGRLQEFGATVLAPLLPVEFRGDGVWRDGWTWRLTESGLDWAVTGLDMGSEDQAGVWASLRTPRRAASVEARPGAEVMLELVDGERRLPVVVTQSVGGGRTFFMGSDESHLWRYERGERIQHAFWSSVAAWGMETPFHARDARSSVAVDKLTYERGEPILVRARLFDEHGRPVTEGGAQAWFYRDGEPAGRLELVPDVDGGGLWTGQTSPGDPPLEAGTYELAVGPADVDEPVSQARTIFQVLPTAVAAGERAVTFLDETQLRQLAEAAGGLYLREEHLHRWVEELQGLERFRRIEHEMVLGRSYAWFIPIILLLTLEWVLRKRSGLL